MPDRQKQPKQDDVVLGGQAPPPIQGMVLGGIEGVKLRLSSPVIDVRVAALNDALNYADAGLDLIIQALQDESRQVQRCAYQLLRCREEPQVKQVLNSYKHWNLVERLQEYGKSATRFANRSVAEFDPETGITDPVGTAYALRCEYDDTEDITDKLSRLLQDPKVSELEALVFGVWSGEMYDDNSSRLVNALVAAKKQLANLKALFIGDIISEEWEISWINQSDISPILQAYPQLEILQVRGGNGLEFSPPVRHDNLQALIIETGGLSRSTVAQIYNLNLPKLEHLELWFGSEDYGGDCWVESLNPILFEQKFPNLTYLGLRNSQFTDEIAEAVVRSPLLQSISVLDLSMGTLSDSGAEVLLHCSAIHQLDLINLSENFLSEKMVQQFSQIGKLQQLVIVAHFSRQLAPNIKLHIIASGQKEEDDDSYIHSRYCSVAE